MDGYFGGLVAGIKTFNILGYFLGLILYWNI